MKSERKSDKKPDKPFKRLEVIDNRTGQLWKVSCMSCINGHRSNSCGIPVCRPKVFWTVKRPGRPSNSCNCRYASSGRCKCAVVQPTCPHKPNKGGKRTVDCRCDEQSRYCCYLEADHWDALLALQTPRVDFYPNREALDAAQSLSATARPPTPSHSVSTLHTSNSGPSTPMQHQSVVMADGPFVDFQVAPPRRTRFQIMGVGGPWGNDSKSQKDVFNWQGPVPEAPREYPPIALSHQEPLTIDPHSSAPFLTLVNPAPSLQADSIPPVTQSFETMSMAQPQTLAPPATMGVPPFDKLTADYLNYQFPSAICQQCGLNGCTCKNCPPLMQNFGTGSWANCCSRRHARLEQPPIVPSNTAVTPQISQDEDTATAPLQFGSPTSRLIPPFEISDSDSPFHFTDSFSADEFSSNSPPMDISELIELGEPEGPEEPSGAGGGGCCCGGKR